MVRLSHGPTKASVTLENVKNLPVLVATAKNEGDYGNYIRLEIDYDTANPDESFNLRVVEEDNTGTLVGNPEYHTGLVMDPQSARFAPDFVTASSDIIDLALDPGLGVLTNPGALIYTNTSKGFSQSRLVLDLSGGAGITATRLMLKNMFNPAGGAPALISVSVDNGAYVDVDFSGIDPTVGPMNLRRSRLRSREDSRPYRTSPPSGMRWAAGWSFCASRPTPRAPRAYGCGAHSRTTSRRNCCSAYSRAGSRSCDSATSVRCAPDR